MRYFLLVSMLFFSFPEVVSQDYQSLQFSSITSNENLPSDECNMVFQDSDNFLWFGTNEGLYRYDGYEVRDFDKLVKISSKNVKFHEATEDEAGKLWFATSNGVLIYDKKAGSTDVIKPTELIKAKSVSDQVLAIDLDKKGRIWFGGFTGLFLYDTRIDSLIHFRSVNSGGGNSNIRDVMVSQQDIVWVATWGSGLAKFNEQDSSFSRFKIFNFSHKTGKHNVINSLYEYTDNILWVGTWDNGLYAVDVSIPHRPRIIQWLERKNHTDNTILGDIIFNMVHDDYGSLWVGSPHGLSIIQNPLSEKIHIHNYEKNKGSLTNSVVRSVMRDRTGLIWLGTTGGGVNKADIHKKKFYAYAITEVDRQKKTQTVYSFSFDRQNRLLIGVKSLGFGRYDFDKAQFVHYSDIPAYRTLEKLDINTVNNFTWDQDSNLWMGTRYKGLIKFDPEKGKYIRLLRGKGNKKLNARKITSVKKDANYLWAVTENGLFRVTLHKHGGFNNHTVKYYNPEIRSSVSLEGQTISAIAFDRQGYLYVSTFEGQLIKSAIPVRKGKDSVRFEYLIKNTGQPPISINCLFFDSKDRLWIGSLNKGLKIWHESTGKYHAPLAIDRMDDQVIYAITEDHGGHIWATSNQGLLRLSAGEEDYNIDVYTSANGLQGNVFIKGAMVRDKNGHIYVGGHNGFNLFNPASLEKEDVFIPKIAFTHLKTGKKIFNAQSFHQNNPFVIKYDDNLFSISFSALDMRASSETRYAYQLEGLEDSWQIVSADLRTATYMNLEPGQYTFKVMGTNATGRWNSEMAVLPITVTTAPYFTWWAYTLYITTILGVILMVFILYRNQMKARQKLKIEHLERTKSEKLNQFKLQFFTNLSHELLTPLSILLILSEKLSKYDIPECETLPGMFRRNVDKLHHQIKQMLQFRKAEAGNLKLLLSRHNLDDIIRESYENYLVISEEKNIAFQLKTSGIGDGFVDKEKLDICLNNLLSNAFKYTKKGGVIALEVESLWIADERWMMIKVKDNGRGIPKEHLKHIFHRFYRTSGGNDTGIGIGLALTKNMVNLQGGSIKVESEPDRGSVFTLQLPISLSSHRGNTLSETNPMIPGDTLSYRGSEDHMPIKNTSKITRGQKKIILIVDDNEDFLTLVALQLEKYYHIITAVNGKEAFDLANENEVDLIVSDLMIPGMDGYQLCKAVKNDLNTSHIPFIIVTVNASDDSRAIGYEAGVDSYLTKPMDMQVLFSRIESLLKKRNEIHKKFNTGAFLEPNKIVTTSFDEKVLSKAKAIVENHLSDPELTVKVLCDELGMSNSMLYRKIKGLLNLTPNEFIRNIRLRKAAQLLEDKSIHISEVAYQAGFNDLSYFGVCFKKQYGVTPSVFQKENSNEKRDVLISMRSI